MFDTSCGPIAKAMVRHGTDSRYHVDTARLDILRPAHAAAMRLGRKSCAPLVSRPPCFASGLLATKGFRSQLVAAW